MFSANPLEKFYFQRRPCNANDSTGTSVQRESEKTETTHHLPPLSQMRIRAATPTQPGITARISNLTLCERELIFVGEA
jgi:hypothetical protein